MGVNVLVIEDEPKIASLLSRGLREEGHGTEVAEDMAAARAALSSESFDLLIVDRMLPDGDGMDVVRELRTRGDATPAICVTARDGLQDRVDGLNGGADDYLIKPFSLDELFARVAAVRRRGGRFEGRIDVGSLRMDLASQRAWRGTRELVLTRTEFSLLRVLAAHTGQVMSRSDLLSKTWGTSHDPGTNLVEVYISYVRAKLDHGEPRPLIHTVRGQGYVLDPDR